MDGVVLISLLSPRTFPLSSIADGITFKTPVGETRRFVSGIPLNSRKVFGNCSYRLRPEYKHAVPRLIFFLQINKGKKPRQVKTGLPAAFAIASFPHCWYRHARNRQAITAVLHSARFPFPFLDQYAGWTCMATLSSVCPASRERIRRHASFAEW